MQAKDPKYIIAVCIDTINFPGNISDTLDKICNPLREQGHLVLTPAKILQCSCHSKEILQAVINTQIEQIFLADIVCIVSYSTVAFGLMETFIKIAKSLNKEIEYLTPLD